MDFAITSSREDGSLISSPFVLLLDCKMKRLRHFLCLREKKKLVVACKQITYAIIYKVQ